MNTAIPTGNARANRKLTGGGTRTEDHACSLPSFPARSMLSAISNTGSKTELNLVNHALPTYRGRFDDRIYGIPTVINADRAGIKNRGPTRNQTSTFNLWLDLVSSTM